MKLEQNQWTSIVKYYQDDHASQLDRKDSISSFSKESIVELIDKSFKESLEALENTCLEADGLIQDLNQNSIYKVTCIN